MLYILVLSESPSSAGEILPSLDVLDHRVRVVPLSTPQSRLEAEGADLLMLDAREGLIGTRNTAQLLKTAGFALPVLMVLTEGGMAAVSGTWMVDDILLSSAGPAELEARLRLATAGTVAEEESETVIRSGAVVIDEASYTARLSGAPLNLTYKEFELLKFLAQHSGRVFTRAQLLSEVWGYDYYGGTRTVDVHIRRLRSKLGIEHEHLIATVRNVGYSFNTPRGC